VFNANFIAKVGMKHQSNNQSINQSISFNGLENTLFMQRSTSENFRDNLYLWNKQLFLTT
jgi:hypothetical protein